MSGMKLEAFRQVFLKGGLRRVGVTGAGRAFCITGVAKSGEVVILLGHRPGYVRIFRRAATAILLLYKMGVRKLEVDMSNWSPDGEFPPRPDVSARMKRVHKAAEMIREPYLEHEG